MKTPNSPSCYIWKNWRTGEETAILTMASTNAGPETIDGATGTVGRAPEKKMRTLRVRRAQPVGKSKKQVVLSRKPRPGVFNCCVITRRRHLARSGRRGVWVADVADPQKHVLRMLW